MMNDSNITDQNFTKERLDLLFVKKNKRLIELFQISELDEAGKSQVIQNIEDCSAAPSWITQGDINGIVARANATLQK